MTETTFDWAIAQLERHTDDGVVYTVHWTVTATDGTHSSSSYGSIGLEPPEDDSIIPYENLTSEIVIGWAKDKLDVEQIETSLQRLIDEKHTPTTLTGIPW
jgi:hypothetical protein